MGKFVPNPAFEAQLKRDPMLLDELKEVAEGIAEAQQSLAPEAEGDYIEGIKVEPGVEGDSVVARVNNENWKSLFIEFGTADHPFDAPLRSAVEQEGHRLEGE